MCALLSVYRRVGLTDLLTVNTAPHAHHVTRQVNYMQYKLTQRQVGPLGVSVYTDRNPIRLRFDGCLGVPEDDEDEGAGSGAEDDAGRSLFRQYAPEDDTGKGVKPSYQRWDERFEAAKGKFRATLMSYWKWGSGQQEQEQEQVQEPKLEPAVEGAVIRTEAMAVAVAAAAAEEDGQEGGRLHGLRRRRVSASGSV